MGRGPIPRPPGGSTDGFIRPGVGQGRRRPTWGPLEGGRYQGLNLLDARDALETARERSGVLLDVVRRHLDDQVVVNTGQVLVRQDFDVSQVYYPS